MKALYLLPQKQRLVLNLPLTPSYYKKASLEKLAYRIACIELRQAQAFVTDDPHALFVFIAGQSLCFQTHMPILRNVAYKIWLENIFSTRKPVIFKEKTNEK